MRFSHYTVYRNTQRAEGALVNRPWAMLRCGAVCLRYNLIKASVIAVCFRRHSNVEFVDYLKLKESE